MLFSDEAMDKLNNSVRVNEVDPRGFVALFVPGGHGTSLPSCTKMCLYGKVLWHMCWHDVRSPRISLLKRLSAEPAALSP